MEEFKIFYNHNKAEKILQGLGAKCVKKEILEDLYLAENNKNIWKLSRINDKIQFMRLHNLGNSFEVGFKKEFGKKTQIYNELNKLFDTSKDIMRKERAHYKCLNSVIVLDKIKELGQLVELYPADNKERQKLFGLFKIQPEQLIKESYNSLRLQRYGKKLR